MGNETPLVSRLTVAGGLALVAVLSAAAGPAQPQQTTATFGDWTLRCLRPQDAAKSCEVLQVVQQDGKTVAQIALGATARTKSAILAVMVPPSVSFGRRPSLTPSGSGGDPLMLSWQRCLPNGCVASADIGESGLARMRSWSAPARFGFADGAGRETELPVSPTGLQPALDALAKEDPG